AFAEVGVTIEWQGSGIDEVGIDIATGQVIVRIDPKYFRPAEVDLLIGDASKAKKELNWQPRMTFKELVHDMMRSEKKLIKRSIRAAECLMLDDLIVD
ncbi:MAG TPA: GDP-mannose 4,6-dehydratase, partial [Candidatus Babeliales bacterium]|nr:GDP-mannose 4,6-dehydratase [Candidatus Babeliales bacterium]